MVFYSGPPRSDGERRFGGDKDGYRGGPRSGGEFGDKSRAPTDYQPSFRVPFLFSFLITCFLLWLILRTLLRISCLLV